jgi:hypothetical protein
MCTVSHITELRKQAIFFEALKKFGIPKKEVVAIPDTFADRKPQEGENYYYYNGPEDDKTRKFCKRMLKIDKVFSTTDIEILSNYLDYDVLKYKGSYNCRHDWVKFRGKRISTPEPTVAQIRSLIKDGIKG